VVDMEGRVPWLDPWCREFGGVRDVLFCMAGVQRYTLRLCGGCVVVHVQLCIT
jgi:hypothetical protein